MVSGEGGEGAQRKLSFWQEGMSGAKCYLGGRELGGSQSPVFEGEGMWAPVPWEGEGRVGGGGGGGIAEDA